MAAVPEGTGTDGLKGTRQHDLQQPVAFKKSLPLYGTNTVKQYDPLQRAAAKGVLANRLHAQNFAP